MPVRRRTWLGTAVLLAAGALLASCDQHPLAEEAPLAVGPEGTIRGMTPEGPQAGPLSTLAPLVLGEGAAAPLPQAGAASRLSPPGTLQPRQLAPSAAVHSPASAATPGILWQNTASGGRAIWQMNGPNWDGASVGLPHADPTWSIIDAADFNADGHADLLWQHTPTGLAVIWYMNGSVYTGQFAYLPQVHASWRIAAAADFNADGKPDVLWQQEGTGYRAIWFMNGSSFEGQYASLPTVDPAWQIAGAGDFNGDGKPDLLWQHLSTGHRAFWFLNGAVFEGQSAGLPQVHPSWEIVGVGDFNADGKPDIVWQQLLTGWRAIWQMNGPVWEGRGTLLPIVASEWSIASAFNPAAAPQPPITGRIFGTVTLSGNLHPMFGLEAPADATQLALAPFEYLTGMSGRVAQKVLTRGFSGPGGGSLRPQHAAAPPQPEYMPDVLMVRFEAAAVNAPPAGSPEIGTRATAARVAPAMRSTLAPLSQALDFEVGLVIPASLVARVQLRDAARIEETREQLAQHPAVASVHRVPRLRHYGTPSSAWLAGAAARGSDPGTGQPLSARDRRTLPNDPWYLAQSWHYNMIDMPKAWNLGTGSRNVVVAVLDTGIRFDHPDIAANLTNDGFDFVSQGLFTACGGAQVDRAGDGNGYDPNPTQPGPDYANLGRNCLEPSPGAHGLHVAGTIGAVGNNGAGLTGVNWNVSIRPVRVLGHDGGDLSEIMAGVYYAAGFAIDLGGGVIVQAPSRAHVINLSLGGYINDAGAIAQFRAAFQHAAQAGSLLIAAAGNDNTDAPSYPAAYPEVVSVSALGPNGQRSAYSNYGSAARGSKIDIASPGGNHLSYGDSYGILSTDWNFTNNTPIASFFHGTSMAAPHVAGVAALLLAREPGLTAAQLRARLLNFAVPMGSPNLYGVGMLNARNSLTQTHAPVRALFARLYDATTGAIVREITAAGDQYAFADLQPGRYFVLAGQDEDGDLEVGVPGRRFGGFTGGSSRLQELVIAAGDNRQASFPSGAPGESEPNETPATASRLVLNGYVMGARSTPQDIDFYVITLPAGQYTFETSGQLGACGFINELDTVLELYNSSQQLIASNDDINGNASNYCSRITRTLAAGTYLVRVRGYQGGGPEHMGRYRLEVRTGG